jgi:hypothetical protein
MLLYSKIFGEPSYFKLVREQSPNIFVKLLKEPRNRFSAWRIRFLGIDSWVP